MQKSMPECGGGVLQTNARLREILHLRPASNADSCLLFVRVVKLCRKGMHGASDGGVQAATRIYTVLAVPLYDLHRWYTHLCD